MKYMYNTYYKEKKRGYTDEEFKQGLEKFAGKSLDDFYNKYIYGLTPLDYNKYLGYAGYKITDGSASVDEPTLGINVVTNNGKKIVNSVLRGSAGWIDGINVNDELVELDGHPIVDAATMLNGKKTGDKISLKVNRDGLPLLLPVTMLRNNRVNYKIEPLANSTQQQMDVRRKWLKL